MSPTFKVIRIGVTIALCIAIGLAFILGPKLYHMKSEYVTADVIGAADRFVTEHPGQWPESWQELGGEDLSHHTDFRFDLTAEMILQDRKLIYRAIQAKGHGYRTYPHAKSQLDAIYEKLVSAPSELIGLTEAELRTKHPEVVELDNSFRQLVSKNLHPYRPPPAHKFFRFGSSYRVAELKDGRVIAVHRVSG